MLDSVCRSSSGRDFVGMMMQAVRGDAGRLTGIRPTAVKIVAIAPETEPDHSRKTMVARMAISVRLNHESFIFWVVGRGARAARILQ
eukprot:109469-Prymnesium_polylepis.1